MDKKLETDWGTEINTENVMKIFFERDFKKTSLSEAAVAALTVLILLCANVAENILGEEVQPVHPILRIR